MRKFFGFGSQKLFMGSPTFQQRDAEAAPECSCRISSGPKYHIRDKDLGKIHKAASTGDVQKVQKILLRQKKKCLNERDKKNRTALHLACATGHPEVVTLLTENKCQLNYCDNENRTALIKAIQCQEEECAAILIKCGANPNVVDIDGNTALHFAVAGHNMEIAEELLLNNANIEAKNKDGLTPLLLAIHEHRPEMAKYLIQKNANIHAVDRFKRTSLMLAVNDSSADLVKRLLQEGVDVFAEDRSGSTAEEHAFKTGLTFNYKLIREYKLAAIYKRLAENSYQDTDSQDSTEQLPANENSITDSHTTYPWSKHVAEGTNSVSKKEVDMEAKQTSRSVDESSEEDSVNSQPQVVGSSSSAVSEGSGFHTKNVVDPSFAKIKTVIQPSLKNKRICDIVSTVKKCNEAHHENKVNENKVMVETLPKPSAAIQNSSHPDFPSTGPLLKPSVTSVAVIGLTKNVVNPSSAKIKSAVQQSLKNKRKCGTLSTVKEGNEADRENKVNENKVMVETLPKPSAAIQNGSRPDFPSTEPLHKPSVASVAVVGFTKNVVNPSSAKIKSAVQQSLKNKRKCGTLSTVKEGNEADRENKVNENKVMVETLPKPSAAIQNGSRPDFPSTEPLHKPSVASVAVVGFTKEEAIKPTTGNKGNGSENYPDLKPTTEVKDSLPKKAVEVKGTQSSRSDSSHLDSASLPLNETCQGPGDLKVDNKSAFGSQSMNPKQSASTDIRHMTFIDKCKNNIRAVFLRGDQRLRNRHESQLPENKENEKELVFGRTLEKEQKRLDGSKNKHSQDCSASLPIDRTDDLPGAADQRGKNIPSERAAVDESSEEDSVNSKSQNDDSWSSDDSEELSFPTKKVMNPSFAKIKTAIQQPMKYIEEKYGTLGIVKKGNEADRENEVRENKVMVETLPKPSAAIQKWSRPDFPSNGPLLKPSVVSLAVTGLTKDCSASLPIDRTDDLPGAADQRGKNIPSERAAVDESSEEDSVNSKSQNDDSWSSDDSEELSFPTKKVMNPSFAKIKTAIQQPMKYIEEKYGTLGIVKKGNEADRENEVRENKVMVETLPKPSAAIQKWSRPDFPSNGPLLKPSVVSLAVTGLTKDCSASLPIDRTDDLPGAADQRGKNIPSERAAVDESSEEDSVNSKSQNDDSWSSDDSEELSFPTKKVMNPSFAKIKTAIQQPMKYIEEKYGTLGIVKKGNEADRENEVRENKVMVETLPKPSAAIQKWSRPDFPSNGPLLKPSVVSLAVTGLTKDCSASLPIDRTDDLPGAADQRGKNIPSERAAVDESSEEDSVNSKSQNDDSWSSDDSEELSFPTKKVMNPSFAKIKTAIQQPMKYIEEKYGTLGIVKKGNEADRENEVRENKVMVETLPKPSAAIQKWSRPDFPSNGPLLKPSVVSLAVTGLTKDCSASLPIDRTDDLPGAADQRGKNIPSERAAVDESSEEDSVNSKSQNDDSWSSDDSEELSFPTKKVMNPSFAKIKTAIQQSMKYIEEKYGTLGIVKKGNEADRENEVRENKVMVETLPKPSAAIQKWSRPDFPSNGPLLKPSVVSLAVTGLTKDCSASLPIDRTDDLPGAADQRGKNIPNERAADLSAELVLEKQSEKKRKRPAGSKNKHSQKEAIKPATGNKENVQTSALGREDKEEDSPWDSEDCSASLPIDRTDDLPGAADQRGKNIPNERAADLSAELVLEKQSEKKRKRPAGSKNKHSQKEAIKPATGNKENVQTSALGREDKEEDSPWDSEDCSASLPIDRTDDLPGAADQRGKNIPNERAADLSAELVLEKQSEKKRKRPAGSKNKHSQKEAIKPATGNKENVQTSALGREDKEEDSPWDSEDCSASLPIDRTDDLPGAADQRGKNIPNERAADLSAELVLEKQSEKKRKRPAGSKNKHSQKEAIKPATGNKENVQTSALGREDKEEDSPWDSEDCSASLPIDRTDDLPGAADQRGKNIPNERAADLSAELVLEKQSEKKRKRPAGSKNKHSQKEAIKPATGNKENVQTSALGREDKEEDSPWDSEDCSASLPIDRTDDLPGAADQRGKNIPNERAADLSAELVLEKQSEKKRKRPAGSKNKHSQKEAIKPATGNKENVQTSALGREDKEEDSPWDSEDCSASLPIDRTDDLPGAADQRGKNIPNERAADLSAELVLEKQSEKKRKRPAGSKNKHSQKEAIKPATGNKENVQTSALGREDKEEDSPWDSEDCSASLPIDRTDDLPGAADQRGKNIPNERAADLSAELVLEKQSEKKRKRPAGSKNKHSQKEAIKPATGNKENVQTSALGREDKEEDSPWDSEDCSASLPIDRTGDLPGAADQRGKNIPNERAADLSAELVLEKQSEKKRKRPAGSKNKHSQKEAIKPATGNKENVQTSALGREDKEEDSPWDSEDCSASLPIDRTDDLPGAADQRGKNIPNERAADLSAELVLEKQSEKKRKRPAGSKNKHSQKEAIKPATGNKENVQTSALGREDKEEDSPWDSEDCSASLPIDRTGDLPGAADQRGKNIPNERAADLSAELVLEKQSEKKRKRPAGSKNKHSQKEAIKPATGNKENVQTSALGREDKEEDSPWDSEDCSASLPIDRTDDLPGAADQRGKNIPNERAADLSAELVLEKQSEKKRKRPAGSKNKHSQKEAIKPATGNKENVQTSALGREDKEEDSPWDSEDCSASLPIDRTGDLPGAADQRGKNIPNERAADLSAELVLEKQSEKKRKRPAGSKNKHSQKEAIKPATGNKENVQTSALGREDKEEDSPWDSEDCSASLPIDRTGDLPGAADQRGKNIPNERAADLSAELVLEKQSEKKRKRPAGSKNKHSQKEAIKPATGNKENVQTSALGREDKEEDSPWDSENLSASAPKKYVDHLSGAADQRGENILSGQVEGSLEKYPLLKLIQPTIKVKDPGSKKAVGTKSIQTSRSDSLEKYPDLKPTVKVKDPVPKKTVGTKATQTSRSDSSDLDSARSSLKHRTSQKSRRLKIDDKYPLKSHSMTPNQSAFTDNGHTTIVDQKKMNIGAVFLIEDHRLHDLHESHLPENKESKEDSLGTYPELKPAVKVKDPIPKKAVETKATQTSRSDSLGKYPDLKPAVKVKDPMPKKAVEMKATQTSRSDSLGKYPDLKPAVKVKDPMPKKAVEMKATQTSRSDSLGKYPDLKPAVKVKDPMPKKAVEMKATQTSRSDSLDLDSASLPLSHETSQRSGDLKVDDKRPFVSHLMTPEQSTSTGFAHMTFTDKDKTNSGDVFPGEDHKLHDLRESQLPENRENKEDSLGKHLHLKHAVKVKDSMPKKAVGTKATQTSRSESSLLKTQDSLMSYESLKELRKHPCEPHVEKIKKLENTVIGLQKELSEAKEIKSQLEQQKVEWDGELCNLRLALEKEKVKRRNTEMLYKRVREQLRTKEEQYCKEVETKQLEITLRTLDMELKTVRKNSDQAVEEQNTTQGQLSPEENARMQSPDGILTNHPCKQKETGISLKKINSEASESHERGKGLLHENRMLRDEIAMLRLEIDMVKNQKQKMEKKYVEEVINVQNKNDHLKKNIELYEKTGFQHNEQFNVLRDENTMLKSKLENEKQNKERLETEVASYRSRLTTALHDHEQDQISKRKLELAFQRRRYEWLCLRDKMDFDMSNLKDKNEILSQQLSKFESKFSSREIELNQTRDALREKSLVLESVQKELKQTQCQKKEIEHKYQHEQGEVNKHIEKLESSEKRLSQLQNENMLLQQQMDDIRRKADDQGKALINVQEKLEDTMKRLQAKHETQDPMLDERNRESIDELIHLNKRVYQVGNDKLKKEIADSNAKLETVSSKLLLQEEENQYLRRQLSVMKGIQKKCESLENKNEELKQKLVNIKTHVKMNMVEYSEIEHYKQVIDEKARQEIVKKLEEVNQFLQAQAASQEYIEQLTVMNDASVRSQMERRIQDLLSELSIRKTAQDSNMVELENYKQLYREELKFRMSLENQLNVSYQKKHITKGKMKEYVHAEAMREKVQQELEKNITRELKEAAAEFESESYRPSPLRSIDESSLYQDLVLKTSQEYV